MNQFQLIVLLEVMAHVLLPNQAEPTIKVCGGDLIEAVQQFCGDRGIYSPGEGYTFSTTSTRKGIATLCCESRCPISTLDKYCNKAATPQTTTEVTAPPRVTPSTSRTTQPTESNNNNNTIENEDNGRGMGELKEDRDDNSPSGKDKEETNRPRRPTSVPHHRGHPKDRKNRTSKGSSRRANNTRRRAGSGERRTTSSERREARLRKKEQRLMRKQSNTRKKTKTENRKRVNPVTTPVARAENAEKPLKSGNYNSTSVSLSAVNATDVDTAPPTDTKKGGFLTTITAVLRDKMGLIKHPHADNENR